MSSPILVEAVDPRGRDTQLVAVHTVDATASNLAEREPVGHPDHTEPPPLGAEHSPSFRRGIGRGKFTRP